MGVAKPGTPGVRFADVLVLEEQPPSGQPPRVETFSFKSRNLLPLEEGDLTAQMRMDASDALRYYGGTLNIRRHSLKHLGHEVPVRKVRLIYEGRALKPKDPNMLKRAVTRVAELVKGVEVWFQ